MTPAAGAGAAGGGAEWSEVMGDDIKTKTLAEGTGPTAPMGTIVKCNLRGYLLDEGGDRVGDEPFETLAHQRFKIGETDCIPALELTLRHARLGSTYIVKTSSKFAYGPTGRPRLACAARESDVWARNDSGNDIPAIPPNTGLEYEVRVVNINICMHIYGHIYVICA
jgi:hypothetical protein